MATLPPSATVVTANKARCGPSGVSELLVGLGVIAIGAGVGAACLLMQNNQAHKSGLPTVWSDSSALWIGALFGALIAVLVLVFVRWYLHTQGCRVGARGWTDPPHCETYEVKRETVTTASAPPPVRAETTTTTTTANVAPVAVAAPAGYYYAPQPQPTPQGPRPINVNLFRVI